MTGEQNMVVVAGSAPGLGVNPFEFFPGIASKILGLGGNTPGHDPNYVFHTPYVEAAPGPSRFIVQFHGLRARRGTLWLRVHMLPMEAGARAVHVTSDRIQLNRLIQHNGRCEIGFEGFRAMSFGLYAGIQEDTDAEASDVEVWLDRPADPHAAPDTLSDGRNTRFGQNTARPAIHMLSMAEPRFDAPATQVATTAQITDSSFTALAAIIPPGGDILRVWQERYVFQALKQYGMLSAGAEGLGLMHAGQGLAEALGNAGPSITVAEPALGDARNTAGGRRLVAPTALPADLVDVDFLWSIDVWNELASASVALRFVEDSLKSVRPGGVAVHCGAYELLAKSGAGVALARADVERLLLILISRGHEVAQFRVTDAGVLAGLDGATGAVGIIIRKAPNFV